MSGEMGFARITIVPNRLAMLEGQMVMLSGTGSASMDGRYYVRDGALVREQVRPTTQLLYCFAAAPVQASPRANALRAQLSRARMQCNKHLIADLEKQLRRI